MRIGHQITESLHEHFDMRKRSGRREPRSRLLRSVGIPEPERRLREYPQQLSGGMCQRVMIADRARLPARSCCSPTNRPRRST